MENKHKEALKKIKESKNILLVTHVHPDGDALSSICAMIEFLEKNNKKYFAYCQDKPIENFSFMPQIDKIIFDKKFLGDDLSAFDLIITLDCGSLHRTGLNLEIKDLISKRSNNFIIEIDHHPKVDCFSDLEIRDSEAAATTEILYDFFKINKIKITKNIANCILTGILTDTANFLYPSTSNKTINISSEMLTCGAKFPQITRETWYNKNLDSMRLWGIALKKLKINKKYNIAFSVLTKEEIKKSKDNKDIFDSIAGFLGNLYKVKGIMLLREEDGHVKGSLRTSCSNVDISLLAKMFGGGGHEKASGFLIEGSLCCDENKYKVI